VNQPPPASLPARAAARAGRGSQPAEDRHPSLPPESPLWELRRVSKAFPGVQALAEVSLLIHAHEVHALVGENGSGKSTLVKLLAGVHAPDAGEIRFRGRPVVITSPIAARSYGVATIYQEFSLVPSLTVAENVHLGRLPTRGRSGRVDWDAMRRGAADMLEALGIDIDPESAVGSLSVAQQQLVEIAKAISADSNLLIMDEPTTALSLAEVRRLHDLVRRLAERGRAILYISHRLNELEGLVDTVTVLRDGRLVGSRPSSQLSMDTIVQMMIGSELRQHYIKEHHAAEQPVLEVDDLHTEGGLAGVSFTVHRGEVFGLGGMTGSGRTEIARALFGLDRVTAGTIRIDGRTVRFASPGDAISARLALIPENRKSDGLFFNFTGIPNTTMARLKSLLRGPVLSLRREESLAMEQLRRLQVVPTAATRSVQFLSGGNQQKVVIARWLYAQSRILLLDEPTQGIDVGAKVEVYRIINEFSAKGMAVVLISSDYPELLAMSDRIGIVRRGRIVRITPARDLTEYALIEIASTKEHA
jgi:ribose transport system ATP-binding protein